ncbi:large subunit ribosomal protein L35Ae, partial [Phenoliferia sp. Uapishka_3]
MYFVSTGLLYGADSTVGHMLFNQAAVALGNLIGGGVFMALSAHAILAIPIYNDDHPCVESPCPQIARNRNADPLVRTGLYAKGRVTGFKRGKRNQRVHTSLVQIEGVANKEEAQFYLGKVGFIACELGD